MSTEARIASSPEVDRLIELILRLRQDDDERLRNLIGALTVPSDQDAASALRRLAKLASNEAGDIRALRLALDSALCELYGHTTASLLRSSTAATRR